MWLLFEDLSDDAIVVVGESLGLMSIGAFLNNEVISRRFSSAQVIGGIPPCIRANFEAVDQLAKIEAG